MAIALLLVIPALLALLAGVLNHSLPFGVLVFRVLLPITLSALLYKGHNAARLYIIVTLGLSAGLLVLGSFTAESIVEAVVSVLLGAVDGAVALVLWKSSSVVEYFEAQNRRRNRMLSLTEQDDA